MTSSLWRAPSTLDTTVSKSKTVKTKKQPPTASQIPSTALNIEPTTNTTSLETTTGPHNVPKAGSIVLPPLMPTTTTSLETTTGPHNLPKVGSIVPPPPMPVPTVHEAPSGSPSGSEVELPIPQRSCNLVDDVLELGRICRERKTKLLVIEGSDEKLAEIATRKQ
nr:mucin-2-like [Leptinotarsa decemlineata]